MHKSEQMNILYSREERLLRRRLRDVRRQLEAYDEAVHVETYHDYQKRTGEDE